MTKQGTSRLVLGTAQLGINYGIANKAGRPDPHLAEQIIKTAWENGIREYDTAQAYGNSEQVLGNALKSLGVSKKAKIITKIHRDIDHLDRNAMKDAHNQSLSNLGIPKLYGLMLHREEFLDLWDSGLARIMDDFIQSGTVEHIGISVYCPKRAIQALETKGISLLQIPANIIDRRFEQAGVFELAKKEEKQVYVRSIFLQGLLLLNRDAVPANMKFADTVLKRFEDLTQELILSKLDMTLGYVKQAYPDAKIVFGVDDPEQFKDNLATWEKTFPTGFIQHVKKMFQYVDEKILNAALWPN